MTTRCLAFLAVLGLLGGCDDVRVPVPTLDSISPASGRTGDRVPVTITGRNLLPPLAFDLEGNAGSPGGDFVVSLGVSGTLLEEVRWIDGATLTAVVPAGIEQGTHVLEVVTPGADPVRLTLSAAYEALDGLPPSLSFVQPSDPNGTLAPGETIQVEVQADDPSGVAEVTLSVCVGPVGGPCTSLLDEVRTQGTPSPSVTESAAPVVLPGEPDGSEVRIEATATDTAGNVSRIATVSVVLTAPTLTLVAPSEGSSSGGTLVTIDGGGFDATTSFLFGDAAGGTLLPGIVAVLDATSALVITPPGAGTVDVVARRGGTDAVLPGAYTYRPPPTITRFQPASIGGVGGEIVEIEGTDLLPDTAVEVDGVPVLVTFASATSVLFRAPPGANGDHTVRVTTRFGFEEGTLPYNPVPFMDRLQPAQAPEAGGIEIRLTGTDFLPDLSTQVLVDGVAASVLEVQSTLIRFTAPAGAGTASVRVVSGRHPPSSALTLTYLPPPCITAITPGDGPVAGGNSVTLRGTGFVTGMSVSFAGAAASAVVLSDTEIQATVPAGALPVQVTVDLQSAVTGPNACPATYDYNCTPSVLGSVPAIGPAHVPTRVRILGTCFLDDPGTKVVFGDFFGSIVSITATEIVVDTPPQGAATVPVVVLNSRHVPSTPAGSFQYVDQPTQVDLLAPVTGTTVRPGESRAVVVSATGSGADPVIDLAVTMAPALLATVPQNFPVAPASDAAVTFTFAVPGGGLTDGDTVVFSAIATLQSGLTVASLPRLVTVRAVPTLTSLRVDPQNVVLSANEVAVLRVIGTFSDGRTRDIAREGGITFTPSGPELTVSVDGIVEALSVGSPTVDVDHAASGLSALWPVSIVSGRGTAWPPRLMLAAGQTTAVRFDQIVGTTLTDRTTDGLTGWSSADGLVATVDAVGNVTGVGAGTTTITANFDTGVATATVDVRVGDGVGTLTVTAGAPWYASGTLALGGLIIEPGATLSGFGTTCLRLDLGTAGLDLQAGGLLQVGGGPGLPGPGGPPLPVGSAGGGEAGPGGGGGGAGSSGGTGGAGNPAGADAVGATDDGGTGGGPGGGGGGLDVDGIGNLGSAGGGGGYVGIGGRGGRDNGAAYSGLSGGANAGTTQLGGSGGGGGDGDASSPAAGGGGGAGCLEVTTAATGTIDVAGRVRARGGQGGDVVELGEGGGGGGGSGGYVLLAAPSGTITVTGSLDAAGGAGGRPRSVPGPSGGGGGGGGGAGRVRLEAGAFLLTGADLDVRGGEGGVSPDAVDGESGADGVLELAP